MTDTQHIARCKEKGLDHSAMRAELKDSMVKIEMHHGPLFNLFEYCDIYIRAQWKNGNDGLTTFDVADAILREHEDDNIQIVMLDKIMHKGHIWDIFLSILWLLEE